MIIIKVIHFGIFFKTKIHPFCWVKTLVYILRCCGQIIQKKVPQRYSIFFSLKTKTAPQQNQQTSVLVLFKQPIWQLRTAVYWSASSSKDTSEILRQQQGTEGSCHGDSPSGSRFSWCSVWGRKNAGLKRRFEPRGFTTKKTQSLWFDRRFIAMVICINIFES